MAPEPELPAVCPITRQTAGLDWLSYISVIEAPIGKDISAPVPVVIWLPEDEPAFRLEMVAGLEPALTIVSSSPLRLPPLAETPVRVWAEAPVSRIRLEVTLKLFKGVVEKSLLHFSDSAPVTSTLAPKLVKPPLTVKVLVPVTVVFPFSELLPLLVWKVPVALWASKEPEPALKDMPWLAPTVMPPLAVKLWLTVRAPLTVVVLPDKPIDTALALAVPILTVPVVPVLVPTSIETLPEAPAPAVTLPEAIVMADEEPLATLVVVKLTPPAPCRLKAPLVVVSELAALPVRLTAPPDTLRPALPVIKALKVLAPAQVWAPVLTIPGLVISAQEKVMTPPEICAPLA